MEREVLEQKPFQMLAKWKEIAELGASKITVRREIWVRRTRKISVVIPAHNEEAYLDQTLEALRQQDHKEMEVIVVANGCADRTVDVARGKCDRLIVLSRKSLGVSRNLGARMASGQILVFLDADTILPPDALRKISDSMTEQCAAATVRGKPDTCAPSHWLVYFLKNTVHRLRLHPGSSGVIICWRDHFLQVGGFDEGLEVRENSELMKRLKRFGKYQYFGAVEAVTSMRRYAKKGLWKLTVLWTKVWFQSNFGDLHRRRYEAVR